MTPIISAPVDRTPEALQGSVFAGQTQAFKGNVTQSDGIACQICMAGCNLLSGIKKTLCIAACNATVC